MHPTTHQQPKQKHMNKEQKATISALYKAINADIKECERVQKRAAKAGEYTDAIQLTGMKDAFQKIAFKLKKLLESQP
jgi:DNA-binding ferritin-like protein